MPAGRSLDRPARSNIRIERLSHAQLPAIASRLVMSQYGRSSFASPVIGSTFADIPARRRMPCRARRRRSSSVSLSIVNTPSTHGTGRVRQRSAQRARPPERESSTDGAAAQVLGAGGQAPRKRPLGGARYGSGPSRVQAWLRGHSRPRRAVSGRSRSARRRRRGRTVPTPARDPGRGSGSEAGGARLHAGEQTRRGTAGPRMRRGYQAGPAAGAGKSRRPA